MDFLPESINSEKSKEINIEVKCNVSGLVARLNYKLDACVCPKKKDEQTFWEVQGMAPSKTQVKQEATSCSLLPEMSENCSLVSKAILNNLLKYYKDCVGEVETVGTPESIKKIKIPEMFAGNQDKTDVSKKVEAIGTIPETDISTIPKINVTNSEAQEPPVVPIIDNKIISPSESFIVSINTDKDNIATSSPNEKCDDQTSRDVSVVQALNEARAKIDQALLCMKLNVTQDLSMASTTILLTTPRGKVGPRPLGTPGSLKRSATTSEITQHKASAQKVKQGASRKFIGSI